METVFDFKPTDEELRTLFGDLETAEKMRQYERDSTDRDGIDPDVIRLLIGREQWSEAKKYAQKAEDKLLEINLLGEIDKARLDLD